MRFGEGPESDNFEDRTGQSGGGGMNLGGGEGWIGWMDSILEKLMKVNFLYAPTYSDQSATNTFL